MNYGDIIVSDERHTVIRIHRAANDSHQISYRILIDSGDTDKMSAHDLHKASRRLAEAGCTAHQIKSVGRWSTLKEVERDTRVANQARLARSTIASITIKKAIGNSDAV
ncbi:hypothetical protein BGC31_09055 [Komagataeibacter xylinus]|nr:hypothetical protein BFX83_16510 [Komagataeibacter xylinus]RFP05328.1 hypothetical protein BGC31_09055 [Komagataeibacter xylinus]